jgi:hypothetical protein
MMRNSMNSNLACYICRENESNAMRFYHLAVVFSFFATIAVFSGCKNEQKNTLPNTPETVVVAWQRFIDLNLLDSARMLSSEYVKGYISYLDSLNMGETLEPDYNPIMGLTAKVSADTAECNFYFEDELGEKIPGRLRLVKEAGQWKVDRVIDIEVPFPDTLTPYEEREMFQDSLMKG